ncbi:MAG TPA: hypothetical protein VN862_07050 [Candidatus Acidoferrales bacterium]|nr:hypothetical protein [Candidatus Acidoferrales bacterium]
MNDPLTEIIEEIRRAAVSDGVGIFYGYLADDNESVPTVHWNRANGGDWREFLRCAKTFNATILYLDWAPFEQSEIDEAVSKVESELNGEIAQDKEAAEILNQIQRFHAKVGSTCVIDLAFVANGTLHVYEQTSDWWEEFTNLVTVDEGAEEQATRIGKYLVNKWATALAGDSKYSTSKQRGYLLEKLAGDEFQRLPVGEVLRRAEAIFVTDFKQAADEKLADEIRQLRAEGLNLNAIAMQLGISRDRVSGLLSGSAVKNRK